MKSLTQETISKAEQTERLRQKWDEGSKRTNITAEDLRRMATLSYGISSGFKDAANEISKLQAINAELLAALRDMLDWADKPTQQSSPSWIIGACERARAAIAKAEAAS